MDIQGICATPFRGQFQTDQKVEIPAVLCLTPHFGDYPAKHCGAKALTAGVPPLLAQKIQVWNLEKN